MVTGIPNEGAACQLLTTVHGNVSRCHGCDVNIDNKTRFVVRTYGKRFWTDKTTGAVRSEDGPLYVHFIDTCLNSLIQNFTYSKITVDPQTLTNLAMDERVYLQGIGVTF